MSYAAIANGPDIQVSSGTPSGAGGTARKASLVAIAGTLIQRCWNVRDVAFGAHGDGTSDDAAHIQAALTVARVAGGGVVFLPQGTYKISTSLVIGSKTTVCGVGLSTKIILAAATNLPVFINYTTGTLTDTGIVIRDLWAEGDRANQTADFATILLVRCTHCLIERVHASGALRATTTWGEAIALMGGNHNTVRNCKQTDTTYDGVKLLTEGYDLIEGNYAENVGQAGVQIAYAASVRGYGFSGLENTLTDGCLHNIIANNRVYSNTAGSRGIYIHCGSFNEVVGNTIMGTQQGYGQWGACEENNIAGNVFRVTAIAGVALDTEYSKKNRVHGNVIVGTGASAVDFFKDLGEGNEFTDNLLEVEGGNYSGWKISLTGRLAYVARNRNSCGEWVTVADTGYRNYVDNVNEQVVSLLDGANIAWDLNVAPVAAVTLGANRTLTAPTHAIDGKEYILDIIQDGTGSRTLDMSVITWPAATAPTLTTAAGHRDRIIVRAEGGRLYGNSVLNYDLPGGHSTSFAGSESPPDGWIVRWDQTSATWTQTGGYVQCVHTAATRSAIACRHAGLHLNVDALIKIQSNTKGVSGIYGGVEILGQRIATFETGYEAVLSTSAGSAGTLTINKRVGGTTTTLGITTNVNWVVNTNYCVRLRKVGSGLKAKIWLASEAEPETWDLGAPGSEITDTAITTPGWVGIYAYAVGTIKVSYFAFDPTGGVPAVEA